MPDDIFYPKELQLLALWFGKPTVHMIPIKKHFLGITRMMDWLKKKAGTDRF